MSDVLIGDILPYTQSPATSIGQTIFSTNWTANYPSDVVVYYTPLGNPPNDVTQILNYPADYTVTFVGSQQDVQVTLTTGAINIGDIITITRQTPADRENLYTNTNFTPSMLNNDFGILTLVDQQAQLVNQLIGPRYNYSAKITNVVDTILPILPPNYMWVKNSAGTGIIALPYPSATVPGGGTINPGLINELAVYLANGTTVSGLTTASNGILVTSNVGVPSISSTLPSGLTIPNIVGAETIHGLDSIYGLQTIYDVNGNLILSMTPEASAVNFLNISNNVTGSPPGINAEGLDTNIPLFLSGKGTSGTNIKGFTDGTAIVSGNVGEVITINIPNSAPIDLPNLVITDITSLNLSPGNWFITGNIYFTWSVAATSNVGIAWINTVSITEPDGSMLAAAQGYVASGSALGLNVPSFTLNINTATIIYLSCRATTTSGTSNGCGNLTAIRIS